MLKPNWNVEWMIWLPTWVAAIGLWGIYLTADSAKGFLAMAYIGTAGSFLYVGISFAFHLFALCKADSEGLTTAAASDKDKVGWVTIALALTGVAAITGGMLALHYYILAPVFLGLLAGYHGLRRLARYRTKRSGITLFRRPSAEQKNRQARS